MCESLAAPTPPAAESLAMVDVVVSPQSTSYVTEAIEVFVVSFFKYTVAPVSARVIGDPPDEAAYIKKFGTGCAVKIVMKSVLVFVAKDPALVLVAQLLYAFTVTSKGEPLLVE